MNKSLGIATYTEVKCHEVFGEGTFWNELTDNCVRAIRSDAMFKRKLACLYKRCLFGVAPLEMSVLCSRGGNSKKAELIKTG